MKAWVNIMGEEPLGIWSFSYTLSFQYYLWVIIVWVCKSLDLFKPHFGFFFLLRLLYSFNLKWVPHWNPARSLQWRISGNCTRYAISTRILIGKHKGRVVHILWIPLSVLHVIQSLRWETEVVTKHVSHPIMSPWLVFINIYYIHYNSDVEMVDVDETYNEAPPSHHKWNCYWNLVQ